MSDDTDALSLAIVAMARQIEQLRAELRLHANVKELDVSVVVGALQNLKFPNYRGTIKILGHEYSILLTPVK